MAQLWAILKAIATGVMAAARLRQKTAENLGSPPFFFLFSARLKKHPRLSRSNQSCCFSITRLTVVFAH
ncbi:MAG: hypothetical protein F6K35_09435 [Okeania sp. SIO2H7]|nr:hypothetical protein [Okeania sp. SIO2H7]